MRYGVVSISAAIVLAFAFTGALAQQPTPATQPTPAARWCPGVPETPPPPHFDLHPGDWANIYKFCSSLRPPANRSDQRALGYYHSHWRECANECGRAMDAWAYSKNPPLKPKTIYQSTTKPQGPIQLPGGTTE